jgi:hypothetical protein
MVSASTVAIAFRLPAAAMVCLIIDFVEDTSPLAETRTGQRFDAVILGGGGPWALAYPTSPGTARLREARASRAPCPAVGMGRRHVVRIGRHAAAEELT